MSSQREDEEGVRAGAAAFREPWPCPQADSVSRQQPSSLSGSFLFLGLGRVQQAGLPRRVPAEGGCSGQAWPVPSSSSHPLLVSTVLGMATPPLTRGPSVLAAGANQLFPRTPTLRRDPVGF